MSEHDDILAAGVPGFAEAYFGRLAGLLAGIDRESVRALVAELLTIRESDGVVYVIGNGGSAACASHMVNDLCKFVRPRDGRRFRAHCLADNTPWMTALANDEGYPRVFAGQVEGLVRPGDLVVGISASGESANMVAALDAAKGCGARTAAIVGFDGGTLARIADAVVHVESERGEYGPVEDAHAVLSHLVANYLAKVLGE